MNRGHEAAERYAALIQQAERDLASNPFRLGARHLDNGVICYPLRHSVRAIRGGPKVKNPVHSLLARVLPDGRLAVLGLIGDGASIERQVRVALREVQRRPGFIAEADNDGSAT